MKKTNSLSKLDSVVGWIHIHVAKQQFTTKKM